MKQVRIEKGPKNWDTIYGQPLNKDSDQSKLFLSYPTLSISQKTSDQQWTLTRQRPL